MQPVQPLDPELDAVEHTIQTKRYESGLDYRAIIQEAISQAVDETVDPIRSGRWEISQLSKPEKTIIGTRVENVLRMALGFPRARRLDMVVAGVNVDIKFTIGSNWAIPSEADGQILFLARFDEAKLLVRAGLQRARPEWLNPGRNRDSKRGLNPAGMARVRWLVFDETPLTSIIGFMAKAGPDARELLTDTGVGAQVRINRLFTLFRGTPVPESAVQAVAQHFDWTRRLRPDASNPRSPEHQGYEVLRASSFRDRQQLERWGLPPLPRGYCIAVSTGT